MSSQLCTGRSDAQVPLLSPLVSYVSPNFFPHRCAEQWQAKQHGVLRVRDALQIHRCPQSRAHARPGTTVRSAGRNLGRNLCRGRRDKAAASRLRIGHAPLRGSGPWPCHPDQRAGSPASPGLSFSLSPKQTARHRPPLLSGFTKPLLCPGAPPLSRSSRSLAPSPSPPLSRAPSLNHLKPPPPRTSRPPSRPARPPPLRGGRVPHVRVPVTTATPGPAGPPGLGHQHAASMGGVST